MVARQDSLTFKYGQPLFAAAWPCKDIILVAGGGGRAGTGIENRIIAGVKLSSWRKPYHACVFRDCFVQALSWSVTDPPREFAPSHTAKFHAPMQLRSGKRFSLMSWRLCA
jgi:hypothetical protein